MLNIQYGDICELCSPDFLVGGVVQTTDTMSCERQAGYSLSEQPSLFKNRAAGQYFYPTPCSTCHTHICPSVISSR